MKLSPTRVAPDCQTNSPCQHLGKSMENGMENMHGVSRVKVISWYWVHISTGYTCNFRKK